MTVVELLQTGLQRYNQGRSAEAEKCFREVLSHDKDNIHGLNLLGMVYVNSNRADEAVELIKHALSLKPDDHKAQANLGIAYQRLGDLSPAEHHFRLSLQLSPQNPSVWNNLGLVFNVSGRYADAVKSFEKALQLDGNYPQCWINLSQALAEWGKLDKSLQAVSQALKIDPKMPEALHQLAEVYSKKSCYTEAISAYKKGLALEPRMPDWLLGMAVTYRQMDDVNSAFETLSKALEHFPNHPKVYSERGVLQEQMGNKEQAAESFKKSIELAPNVIAPYYQLSQIKGRKTSDEEVEGMERLQETLRRQPHKVSGEAAHLYFALAEAYDQQGKYDEAFNAWSTANGLRASKVAYDPETRLQQRDKYLQLSREMINNLAAVDRVAVTPRIVFVVGMPRSGTSLTDQVLMSHSQLSSLGEVSYVEELSKQVEDLVGKRDPEGLAVLTAEHLDILRDSYLSKIQQQHISSSIVLDKTPMNFQYLGLLAEVFPDALFIHCHRNPIDNCFSIFKLPFSENQDYSHSLSALGHSYKLYRGMMSQWQGLYPGRILDVCYEDTVTDLEAQAGRMVDFLGVSFEPRMLEFYQSERLVRTPSASQVRQPIYTSSVAAWKKYEKHLAPLVESLKMDE